MAKTRPNRTTGKIDGGIAGLLHALSGLTEDKIRIVEEAAR